LPPVASVLGIVLIYGVALSGPGVSPNPQYIAFLLVGGALYSHIAAYSWVATLAIAEGKWTYVFQSVFISPKSATPYLAGRTLASFVTSAITSMLALTIGWLVASSLFPASPIVFNITIVTVPLFLLALVVNILASMGLGFMLGAYSVFSTKFEWALPTYISGLLMLFSEALFPVRFLPTKQLQDFAGLLPFTNLMRAARAAILPGGTLASYSWYLGLCLIGGIIFFAIGLVTFRFAENYGRRKGVLDRKAV
jgi:ABC-type polysaccharide/polyol phosphate export permease